MFRLFGLGGESSKLTSLKLARPAVSEQAPVASEMKMAEKVQAQEPRALFEKSAIAEDARRRTEEMVASGKSPQALYYAIDAQTKVPIAFVSPDKTRGMLLVFSSVFMAHALFRPLESGRTPFTVMEFALDDMDALAQEWQMLGFNGFFFDLTPKTKSPRAFGGGEGPITKDLLVKAWIASRVSRSMMAGAWQAEILLSGTEGATAAATLKNQRQLLEYFRDFGGYDVPFVHWVIALIAVNQGDEEGRFAATTELERFGADFVGKSKAGMDATEWGHSLADAYLGLLTEFGMLHGPGGVPLRSILKVEETEISRTQSRADSTW